MKTLKLIYKAKSSRYQPGMDKFKVRLQISYDGSRFCGWQKQTSDPNSVQGTLEKVLTQVFNEPTKIIASSRTDAGVHALRQSAHFTCRRDPRSFPLLRALNRMTPPQLTVKKAWLVPDDFHSLASPSLKTYKYYVWNDVFNDPFREPYSWWQRKNISVDWLNQACQFILGTHDFKSFQTKGTVVKTTVRTIRQAEWKRRKNLLIFTISGNGFLKQMVRNLVGTMVDAHRQTLEPAVIQEIMDHKDRTMAKTTAPPQGLFLFNIRYSKKLEDQCQEISP